jgi:hypothetical protein
MPQNIVEWPYHNNLEEQQLGFVGPGPVWTWRLYNLTTGAQSLDCPGGIGEIDGQLTDRYRVFGVDKANTVICSYEDMDLVIRPTSGLCRVGGCVKQFDGSARILATITVEVGENTISKAATSLGNFFFYLQPGCKPKLWIEPDDKVLWFQVPNMSAVDYKDLTKYGYYIPRRPEP